MKNRFKSQLGFKAVRLALRVFGHEGKAAVKKEGA